MKKKTTYVIEENKDCRNVKRIDELEDGNQTSSTILQKKDSVILQMNKNHQHS